MRMKSRALTDGEISLSRIQTQILLGYQPSYPCLNAGCCQMACIVGRRGRPTRTFHGWCTAGALSYNAYDCTIRIACDLRFQVSVIEDTSLDLTRLRRALQRSRHGAQKTERVGNLGTHLRPILVQRMTPKLDSATLQT
jgi:hypothetical protein